MALIAENGTGVTGAESYATIAALDAWWAARSHKPYAATWAALGTPAKEGSAREAAAYLDARYGARYRGARKTSTQGLLWPRVGPDDEDGTPTAVVGADGFDLADLPPQLLAAMAEVAVRAATSDLAPDIGAEGLVKTHKLGDASVTFQDANLETGSAATIDRSIGILDAIMAPILRADALWPWL
jgi:hypothetical protein